MDRQGYLVRTIKEEFKSNKSILVAYLFGYQVRGTANSYSDIDIAVLFDSKTKEGIYTDKQISVMNTLSRILNKEVDVVVFNKAPLFLKYHILKDGLKVYEKPDRNEHSFEALSIVQYFDFLPIKQRIEEAMLAKIKRVKNG